MSGMTYRPITDTWILGRCKHGYHGGFAVGFLERARELLPVTSDEGIWHFCSGRVQDYKGKVGGIPLKGFSKNDLTFDIMWGRALVREFLQCGKKDDTCIKVLDKNLTVY